MKNSTKQEDAPILIPADNYLEGYIKSTKSIRLECNFNGTILSKKKVILDSASFVTGDIICENLILSGRIKGNVFCVGRITMNEGSIIEGKVYTSAITSLTETDSDFVIQIPKKKTLEKIRQYLNEVSTDIGLSKDVILTTIRESFYENSFAHKKNPNELISHEFTKQLRANVKPKSPQVPDNQKFDKDKKEFKRH